MVLDKISPAPLRTREQVANALRDMVVRGEVGPGQRMPVRQRLIRKLGVSGTTIQKAVDQLVDEGFLWARRRAGTFVADTPPHLARFAVVFPWHENDSNHWTLYHRALNAALGEVALPPGHRFQPLYAGDWAPGRANLAAILRDFHNHQYAGVIFAGGPAEFMHTGILAKCPLPSVALADRAVSVRMPSVYVDQRMFWARAAESIRQALCHRPAVLLSSPGLDAMHVLQRFAELGVQVPEHFVQYAAAGAAHTTRQVVKLLFSSSPSERPDALLIADDNLTAAALAEIQVLGLQAPRDLHVVSHCNYPTLPAGPTPGLAVEWLGFDARQIIETCLGVLSAQLALQPAPSLILIPPTLGVPDGAEINVTGTQHSRIVGHAPMKQPV